MQPMSEAATTRMSSKGQVVIPERIRAKLGLEPGVELVVIGEGDTIVLKRIDVPRMSEFAEIVARARLAARRAGMKRSDVAAAIDAVRAR
jgi:AbrB family looped-hinge helix DNA binding protein